MYDKKQQLKRKKKEKIDRKSEKREAKSQHFKDVDSKIYEAVKERAYDWQIGTYRCEHCGKPIADNGDMHHLMFRSHGGKTSLDNVQYWCDECHDEFGHGLKRAK